ncbi:hypothetical protein BOTNAR_0144g00110 [Botryotinia narcissicola]|uniref:Uncharacterized protein n=1 Tax=Botryotinia narcissicola TaxID=278944 RepID=A0A4Z1IGB8_9HELO|nr:hypothetical protein BOTNAR_0144g00110 [Botryotinia narcissicola]
MAGLYSRFRPLQSEERIRHMAGSARSTLLPEPEDGLVSQIVDLESHELFSQLCTITNIVKVGPKRGLFLSCVNIGEGVIRDRDEANKRHIDSPEERENRLLWTDTEKHVGLKFKVSKWEEAPAPILLHRDEEAPVFYKLQYEELVLRTTRLLLHVEEYLKREVGHSSKAIVIGSWDY